MSGDPKVGTEAYKTQTEMLYARIGKIAVLGEHLNHAMFSCCRQILEVTGLPQVYAQTALIGQNLENMRRTWESLMKVYYAGDKDAIAMIDHMSNRIDNVTQRRNNTVHRLWFIGWGNEETDSYEVATSMKGVRNIGKNGQGGVKYTSKDTSDFEQIIEEMEKATAVTTRFIACIAMQAFDQSGVTGRPSKNMHYDATGQLVASPPQPQKD
ncbi:MAG: hypothetical protein HYU58_08995 [Proteobacteria bacterium]|nr:hypothetical protein [Pseudomonadota bacterium]